MNIRTNTLALSPSLLAKKIICPAYVPAPFNNASRLKFLGLHAMAVVQVIARHLSNGYLLKSVERGGRGFRIDLLFQDSSGKFRVSEVKSAGTLKESHRIQAALYLTSIRSEFDEVEVVVSNSKTDEFLSLDFINEVTVRAEATRRLLETSPELAATTYRPNQDCCSICDNRVCPFLKTTSSPTSGDVAN